MNERIQSNISNRNILRGGAEMRFENQSFIEFLDIIGQTAPEVETNKEVLVALADELLQKYKARDEFFNAEDNAIGLLLASGLQKEAYDATNKSAAKQVEDEQIADLFAKTLFGPYSDRYRYEGVRKSHQLEPEQILELHLRYTNHDLSRRLTEWFDESIDLQQTADTSDSFEILVLSMAAPQHTKGLQGVGSESEPPSEYIQGLYDRAAEFNVQRESGSDEIIPFAYVTDMFDKTYMCIVEPFARIVLEPESVGYTGSEDVDKTVRSLFRHERTHTQGNVQLVDPDNEEVFQIGGLLEELRAEVLSGCNFHRSYYDIYNAAMEVKDIKGVDIAQIIQNLPVGGGRNKLELYSALIGSVGLSLTAVLASMQTARDVKYQSSKSSRDLYDIISYENLSTYILRSFNDDEVAKYMSDHYTTGRNQELVLEMVYSGRTLPSIFSAK